jgi:3-oxoacyl-(acyl-carrier-protein) synthase
MGVVTGYGRGTQRLWDGMASGRPAVREHLARFAGKAWQRFPMAALSEETSVIAADLPNQAVVRHDKLEQDRDLIVIADSVREAILDAGLEYDPDDNHVGLVVTHESPGVSDHLQGFFRWGEMARAWLGSRVRFQVPEFLYQQKSESVYRLHSFLYIHYLAALFRLHGFSLYNNNACASGAFALAVAADRIRSGTAPAMVVVGGDVPEDGTKFRWFEEAGLYSTRGECSPFREERDGLILGTGAGAIVLEDLEAARAAGKRIYAEWLGGGFSSEGWKVMMPDVQSDRYAAAIAEGLRTAGIAADEVTLITPHGVGAPMLDHFEAETLAEIFPDDGRAWPPILTVKAALGHTLGACVLVELIASLMTLERRSLPEVIRCSAPDPKLPIGRQRDEEIGERWVLLKCTNGFAGQNSAVILRSPES